MSYSGIRWRRHVLLDLEYCNAHYCDRVRTTDIVMGEYSADNLALQHQRWSLSMPSLPAAV